MLEDILVRVNVRNAQSRTMPDGSMPGYLVLAATLQYLELTDDGWFHGGSEPVNQVPTFQMWREHLTRIAYELQYQHFERGALRSNDIRGHFSRPSNISTEDGIRNANVSQWGREEIGRLWRELARMG